MTALFILSSLIFGVLVAAGIDRALRRWSPAYRRVAEWRGEGR